MVFSLKNKTSILVPVLLFAAIALAGCWSNSSSSESGEEEKPGELPDDGVARHALTQMDSCDAFVEYAKAAAIQRIQAYAETQKTAIEQCWDYGDTETDGAPPPTGADGDADSDADADADGDSGGASPVDGDVDGDFDENEGGGEDSDHSETNTQEKGVDEADMIKTDGDYLYALSGSDLVIVEAGGEGTLEEAGRIEVGGRPSELFLYGDLIVVFSNLQRTDVPESIRMPRPDWLDTPNGGMPEWEGDYYSDGYTQVAIIDAGNRSSPVLLRNITYAGSYVTSRRVDSSMRAVISTSTPALDIPIRIDWYDYCQMPEEIGKAVFIAAHDAFVEEATNVINSLSMDDLLPKKIDRIGNANGTAEPIVDCSEVYGPGTAAGTGLLTVTSIDLQTPETKATDIAVFGDKGLVYASKSGLYLTSANEYVQQAWIAGMWADETSGIHKFDIASNPQKAIYKATGTVTGRMLNQFCLGEHDGFLRVATTTGDEWDSSTWDNHISIFEEIDGELAEVSHLGGIGKEEQEKIYAARFMGERGFLVTFRQTDPLFTFDLSDPYNPKKIGEWEGPGFSTYLHPYGEDHLIAVGREDWRFAISLYDLSNFAKPTLVERVFPGENSGNYGDMNSASLDDHKAFYFDADKELLALPYHGWTYDEYNDGYDTGIILYNLSQNGFEDAGQLSLDDSNSSPYYYSEGAAQRSAFIGNTLYGISGCRITSADLSAPAEALDTIALYTGTECNEYGDSGGDDGGWEGGDMDADTDWGEDSSSDMDIDMDGDADGDTDGDTDADIDTDADMDTDTDWDTETSSDSE
ncbi:MAG: hypothetical protein GY854_01570 [Deltaproteobacteria bacterium]|nr:hypothetical protein [Deltaproteobacteria bacterium]